MKRTSGFFSVMLALGGIMVIRAVFGGGSEVFGGSEIPGRPGAVHTNESDIKAAFDFSGMDGSSVFTPFEIFDSYGVEPPVIAPEAAPELPEAERELPEALREPQTKLVFSGKELDFNSPVINRGDRTYFPFSELIKGIGGAVEWNAETKSATATLGNNSVEFTSGFNKYRINGRIAEMDTAAFIENGSLYLPVQYACEGLGLKVDWDSGADTVTLSPLEPKAIDDSGIKKALKAYGGTVAVYYENLETGYVYRHNAERVYFAASVIKAPYCLYIYNLAEKGKADLSSKHTYSSGDYRGGTGAIKNMKQGTVFTETELLKYAIRTSDNIALKKLINKYGITEYKAFVSSIGGAEKNVRTVTGANMSANEAGLYAKEIYKYIETGKRFSEQFKKDLMSTSNPMIVSDFPIARKYGWAQSSFHDMAIVYSSSPYVLVIMSAREGGSARDFAAFRDISKLFQGFNEQNFVN